MVGLSMDAVLAPTLEELCWKRQSDTESKIPGRSVTKLFGHFGQGKNLAGRSVMSIREHGTRQGTLQPRNWAVMGGADHCGPLDRGGTEAVSQAVIVI